MVSARSGSPQVEHGSVSERLQHVEHSRMRAFTSVIAAARSRAYSSGARRMWNARRAAVFSPMPGSFASAWISRASEVRPSPLPLGASGIAAPDRLDLRELGAEHVHRGLDLVVRERLLAELALLFD